ncbi:MAG: c-type cytochrome, partial [Bacteroidota bacterium]|nr:c-type cytochrome [Bacteroidota bacterium]
MKILRFIPIAALLAFVSLISLQSCSKSDKPAGTTTDSSKTTTTTTPAPSTDATAPAALSDKAKKGQLLYYNTSLGKVKVACATCHSDGSAKTQGNQIRQGHTLAGVTSRTATWNGMYKGDNLKKFAYGASLCAAVFQKRADIKTVDKALSADEVDALNEYLAAINTAPGAMTSNLKIQWVGKPTFSDEAPDEKIAKPGITAIMKLPGDPAKGETVFGASCGTCHSISDKKIGPPMV